MNLTKNERRRKPKAHVDPEGWARKVRTRRRILGIVAAVLLFAGLAFYLLYCHIIPGLRYSKAERSLEQGDVKGALEIFTRLWTYRDANDRAADLAFDLQEDDSLRQVFRYAELGDVVSFGHYEQDGNTENGPEPIQWYVLGKENGRLLLWSVYALDNQPLNTENRDVTWEDCSLRRWLNEDFLQAAFTDAEQALIPTMRMKNENNKVSDTKGGNNTEDQVAVLSYRELLQYGSANPKIHYVHAYPTEYAVQQGVEQDREYGTCKWWMRTPGVSQNTACYCNMAGIPLYNNVVSSKGFGVRPIVWVLVGSR